MTTIGDVRPIRAASGPYARLGLAPGASVADIRRAYRRLVMRFHPDLAGAESLADFLALKAAYETLMAHPRSARPDPWRTTMAPRTSQWRERGSSWAGGRWYWEGLGANAAKRARRERTG